MEIQISKRAFGKTTKMIGWLEEKRDRVLLTFSSQEADRLKKAYPKLEESIFYWEVWLKQQYGVGSKKEVGIDNADMILQNYLSHEVKKITMTEDE